VGRRGALFKTGALRAGGKPGAGERAVALLDLDPANPV
jgi:hypothetical protein